MRTGWNSRIGVTLLAFALVLTWAVRASYAGETLHLGAGVDTPCYSGGCPVWNGELNELSNVVNGVGTMNLFQNSGGAGSLDSPVLLIFAVPNYDLVKYLQSGGTISELNPDLGAGSVLGASLYKASTFPWTVPTDADSAVPVGFPALPPYVSGSFSQGMQFSSSDVYSVLGLTGNNSNNFGNYTQALIDVPNDLLGFDMSPLIGSQDFFFKLYIYTLNTANFAAKDGIQIEFEHAYTFDENGFPTIQGIPLGTIVTAWGQETSCNPHNGRCSVTTYGMPITEAGLVMPPPPPPCEDCGRVPEPSSLLLLTSGLVFAGKIRKSLSRRKA